MPPADSMITVKFALAEGTEFLRKLGVDAARLDMELILAEALGTDRLHLYMDPDRSLMPAERERSREMLARRREREPLAYILGRREFYGLRFDVTPDVLIPRPETEVLVDRLLEWAREAAGSLERELVLADIGTGSGAIAVAAAVTLASDEIRFRWIATDISEAAMAVARANAETHGVANRIDFRLGSLIEPIDEPLDALCSNPPYVPEADREGLMPEVARWEPGGALFSGPNGMGHLSELISEAPGVLLPGGRLFFEIGAGQDSAVEELVRGAGGLDWLAFSQDLAGVNRVAMASRAEDSD